MKVNIVCYEDVNAWILGKFARKMHENLSVLGIESKISKQSDSSFDINHHIIYINYNSVPSSIDTLMITHIDDSSKLNLIKNQLEVSQMGICMSKETMLKLNAFGIPNNKLSFINPAHDNIIKPRKLVVGITCMVQDDGRKREIFLDKLASKIDPDIFSFKIMGRNWNPQVKTLISKGFEVEYDSEFNYDKYVKLVPSLDYYLYMGQDEGQMGFVDALCAGVKTITTPQGYHLDAENGIYYSFTTYDDLLNIFLTIESEKKKIVNSVSEWTWLNYTRKHVEIWEYLIALKQNQNYKIPTNFNYNDGINSISYDQLNCFNKKTELRRLRKEYLRHVYYIIKNRFILNNKYFKKIFGN